MLTGKNLVLRPLKADDVEKINGWRNNLELIRLAQGIRFPKTLEMDKHWLDTVCNDMSNKNIFWGIVKKDTNELIGIAQLNAIDYISGTANWGISIGETSLHGKGHGVEALKLMLDYAFFVLNLRKVTSYNLINNKATLRFQEKVGGAIQEGVLKSHVFFYGEYHDVVILSLFRENYVPYENK